MARSIEIGTFQIEIKVENGQAVPSMDFIQNNLAEALPLIPEGHYQWRMTMTLANASRPDKAIQEYINAGEIECPTLRCGTTRAVDSHGQVAPCDHCKDGRFWNLMVSTA